MQTNQSLGRSPGIGLEKRSLPFEGAPQIRCLLSTFHSLPRSVRFSRLSPSPDRDSIPELNPLSDGPESTPPASTKAGPARPGEMTQSQQPPLTSGPPSADPENHLGSTAVQTARPAGAKEEEEEAQSRRAPPRTIFFAVSIGLIATICMLVWVVSDQMNSFTGADTITQLLDSADGLKGNEFEPVEASARDLEDWFFLKHGLEHYAVPKEFADTKTVGCRVFKFNGTTIAQVMAEGEKRMLFYLFPSAELGIKVRHGKWAVVDGDQWVGGVTAVGDTCFVVAFQGTQDEMKKYLAKNQ